MLSPPRLILGDHPGRIWLVFDERDSDSTRGAAHDPAVDILWLFPGVHVPRYRGAPRALDNADNRQR
jgi:hypothetical protein